MFCNLLSGRALLSLVSCLSSFNPQNKSKNSFEESIVSEELPKAGLPVYCVFFRERISNKKRAFLYFHMFLDLKFKIFLLSCTSVQPEYIVLTLKSLSHK